MRFLFRHLNLKRLAALWVLVCLTGEQCIAAPYENPAYPSVQLQSPAAFLADLSPEIARVENVWLGSSENPVFLLIQDPHGHPDGQNKIEKLLNELHKNPGIGALYLEGGNGPLDASGLQFFKAPDLNRRAAEFLASEGEIGGAEMFLLSQTGFKKETPLYAQGVEDPVLYAESLKLFRDVMDALPESEAILEKKRSALLKAASEHLDPASVDFLKSLMSFEIMENDYPGLARLLIKEGGRRLGLPWEDPSLQKEYPMMIRLSELFRRISLENETENGLERKKILGWLDDRDISFSAPLSSADEKVPGRHRASWEQFHADASQFGLHLEDYPHLMLSEGARILKEELDAAELSEEMDLLRSRLFTRMAGGSAQREILEAYENYRLLSALLNLKLTRAQYATLIAKPSFHFEQEKGIVKKSLRFYELAVLRDVALIHNARLHAGAHAVHFAVMVAGGFHTDGFLSELRGQNISYAVLTPRISVFEGASTYLRSITGRTIADRYHLRNPTWLNRWGAEIGPDLSYRRGSLTRQIHAQWGQEAAAGSETVNRSEMRKSDKRKLGDRVRNADDELPAPSQVLLSAAIAGAAVGALFYLGYVYSDRPLNEGGVTTLGDLFRWAGYVLGSVKALVLVFLLPVYAKEYILQKVMPDYRERDQARLDALGWAISKLDPPAELTDPTIVSVLGQARERYERKMKTPRERKFLFFTSAWAERGLRRVFEKDFKAIEAEARKKAKPAPAVAPTSADTAGPVLPTQMLRDEVKPAISDRKQKKKEKRQKRKEEKRAEAEPVPVVIDVERAARPVEDETAVSSSPQEIKRRALEIFRGRVSARLAFFEILLQTAEGPVHVRGVLAQYREAVEADKDTARIEAGAAAGDYEAEFTAGEKDFHFSGIYPELPVSDAFDARILSLEENSLWPEPVPDLTPASAGSPAPAGDDNDAASPFIPSVTAPVSLTEAEEEPDYDRKVAALVISLERRLGSFAEPQEVAADPEASNLRTVIQTSSIDEAVRLRYMRHLDREITRLSYRVWEKREDWDGLFIDSAKKTNRRIRDILKWLGDAKNVRGGLEDSVREYGEVLRDIIDDPAVPMRLKSRAALGLAHDLVALKRFDEAILALDEALRRDPWNLFIRTQKAFAHLQASDKTKTNPEEAEHLRQAVYEADHALAGFPDNWPAVSAKLSAMIDLAEDARGARDLAAEIERRKLYGPNRAKFDALRSRMRRMGEPAILSALQRLNQGIRRDIADGVVTTENALLNHYLVAEFREVRNRPGVERGIYSRYEGDLESALRTLKGLLAAKLAENAAEEERQKAERERLLAEARRIAVGNLETNLQTLQAVLHTEAVTGSFSAEDLAAHPAVTALKDQIREYAVLDAQGPAAWTKKLKDVITQARSKAAEVREQIKAEASRRLETELERLRTLLIEAADSGTLSGNAVPSDPAVAAAREKIESFVDQYGPADTISVIILDTIIGDVQARIRTSAAKESGLARLVDSAAALLNVNPGKYMNPEDAARDPGLTVVREQIALNAPNDRARQRLRQRLETGIDSTAYEVWRIRNDRERADIGLLRMSNVPIQDAIRGLGAAGSLSSEGNYERALDRYSRVAAALARGRNIPFTLKAQASAGLAKMLLALGRAGEAAQAFGEGLLIDPWNPYLRVQKADAHLAAAGNETSEQRARHLRNAIEEAGRVLAAQPMNWAAAQVVLDAMNRLAEDPEGAEALLKRVDETRMYDRERGKLDRLRLGVLGIRERRAAGSLAQFEKETLAVIQAGGLASADELKTYPPLIALRDTLDKEPLGKDARGRVIGMLAESIQSLEAAIAQKMQEAAREEEERKREELAAKSAAAFGRLEKALNTLDRELRYKVIDLQLRAEKTKEEASASAFVASVDEAERDYSADVFSTLRTRFDALLEELELIASGLEAEDEALIQAAVFSHPEPLRLGRSFLERGKPQGAGIAFREALSFFSSDPPARLEMALEAAALDTIAENHARAALILEEELLLLPTERDTRLRALEKKVRIELARSLDRLASDEQLDAFRAGFIRYKAAEILAAFPGFEDDVSLLAAFEDVTRTLKKGDEPETQKVKNPLIERDQLVQNAAETLRAAFQAGGAIHASIQKLEEVPKSAKMDRKKRGEALRIMEEIRQVLAPYVVRLAEESALPPEALPLLQQDAEQLLENEIRRIFPIRTEYVTGSTGPRDGRSLKVQESLTRRWPLDGALNWTQLIYQKQERGYLGPMDSDELRTAVAASTGVYMFRTTANGSGRKEGLDVELFYEAPPRRPQAYEPTDTVPPVPPSEGLSDPANDITPVILDEPAAESDVEVSPGEDRTSRGPEVVAREDALGEKIRKAAEDPLYALDYAASFLSTAHNKRRTPDFNQDEIAWYIEAAGKVLEAGAAILAAGAPSTPEQRSEYLWLSSQYQDEAGRAERALELALAAVELLDRETQGRETNSYIGLWESWILSRSPGHPVITSRVAVRNAAAGISAIRDSGDVKRWEPLNSGLVKAAAENRLLIPRIVPLKQQLLEILLEWADPSGTKSAMRRMVDTRMEADPVLRSNDAVKQVLYAMIEAKFAEEAVTAAPASTVEITEQAPAAAERKTFSAGGGPSTPQRPVRMDTAEQRAVLDIAPEADMAARIHEDLTGREETEEFSKDFLDAEEEFYEQMMRFLDKLGSSGISGEMISRNEHEEIWSSARELNELRDRLFTQKVHMDPNRNERFVYAFQLGSAITTIVFQKLKGPAHERQFSNAIFGWAYHQLNNYDSSYRLPVRLKYYTVSRPGTQQPARPEDVSRSKPSDPSRLPATASPKPEPFFVVDLALESALAARLLEDTLTRERSERTSEKLTNDELFLYDKMLKFLEEVKKAKAGGGIIGRDERRRFVELAEELKTLRDRDFFAIDEKYKGNQDFYRLHVLTTALRKIFVQKLQGPRNSYHFAKPQYSRHEAALQTFDPAYRLPEIEAAKEEKVRNQQVPAPQPESENTADTEDGEARSELRAEFALAVAVVMTAGILAPDSPYLETLLAERTQRAGLNRLSSVEKERLTAELSALRPEGAGIILPASLLLSLDRAVREELMGLWAQGLAASVAEETPQFYFTGAGAEELREEIFAYPVMRTRLKSAGTSVPFSSLIRVERLERSALDRLKKTPSSISFWQDVPEDRSLSLVPSLLVARDEVLKLDGADRFRFIDRLMKVQWLLAKALSGLRAEQLDAEEVNRLTAELLRKMGAEFTLGPSGIVVPSPLSLLSDTVTRFIEAQARIQQSA